MRKVLHAHDNEPRPFAGTVVPFAGGGVPPLAELFDNGNPVEVEVGCGKAKFLIPRAQENPHVNFLGIDVVWKWMKVGVQRTEKRGLENLRYLKADARDVLQSGLPPGSVSIFHIYFPDPWPKRRHRKRRLVTGDSLALMHSRLVDGGLIELATDHPDYFNQMRRAVVQSGISWSSVRESRNERLFDAFSKTNYELKYEAAGRTLCYLELRK